jgi:hypothetical protein
VPSRYVRFVVHLVSPEPECFRLQCVENGLTCRASGQADIGSTFIDPLSGAPGQKPTQATVARRSEGEYFTITGGTIHDQCPSEAPIFLATGMNEHRCVRTRKLFA